MSSPGDKIVVLNVLLNCEETKSSKTKQVHFQSLPTTPLEIKKKIEEDFSIPSCVQTLHYHSMIQKDSDQLQHTHFRSGDTFTVDYPIEAECQIVQNVIKWLKEIYDLLQSIEENISSPCEETKYLMPAKYHKIENLIQEGDRNDTIGALSVSLFLPYTNKTKLINKFYFQLEGGLNLLMKIFGILINNEWGALGINKEFHIYLEHICAHTVSNFGQTHLLLRQIVQLGGLEICTTMLLRRKLWGAQYISNDLFDTLDYSLSVLSK